ncbi:MAG TPA: CBS domain-containing protein [Candidatus Dormibacteraeota bacterium]|nr:CBS domain-containing protein [Candidatus Dormibacteraeota bacterium]HEX2681035.1 CBS domain-containing protein [Candidatus Dormibacteraeota bacterium]
MRVRDLPPGRLLSISPTARIADVARQMRLEDSDSIAVMQDGRLVGIVTERDLVRAIAEGVDPKQVNASVIMSANPATVEADEDVSVVALKMMRLGIRHLPVVDEEGTPIGLLSARNLMAALDRANT